MVERYTDLIIDGIQSIHRFTNKQDIFFFKCSICLAYLVYTQEFPVYKLSQHKTNEIRPGEGPRSLWVSLDTFARNCLSFDIFCEQYDQSRRGAYLYIYTPMLYLYTLINKANFDGSNIACLIGHDAISYTTEFSRMYTIPPSVFNVTTTFFSELAYIICWYFYF